MSVSDFKGRLLEPKTGRLQRLLSKRASTDCCNIRFSLRMMTSGALRSTNFLSRLLRLMMRRYKSLRSLVAKFPESKRTSGRRSGGITGMHSSTIHSGLFCGPPRPLSRNASTTLRRLVRSRCFWREGFSFLLISVSSSRSTLERSTKLSRSKSFLTASAPMSASKPSP